jgi:hypothetical protein
MPKITQVRKACDDDTTPPSFGHGEEELVWITAVGNQKKGGSMTF